jgi:AcrR family transcriptional regulator
MYSLTKGKVRQKVRTFNALVETAAHLISERKNFTVADVADLAKVGRTTAYRYFPTLDTLTAQAVLWQVTRIVADHAAAILPESFPIEQRLASLVDMSDRSTSQYETEQRTMLRLSLDDSIVPRGGPKRLGLRLELVDKAIAGLPPKLGSAAYSRLRAALCLFIGIESTVVLRDVCMLDAKQARAVKLWGAQCVLQVALGDIAKAPKRKTGKSIRSRKYAQQSASVGSRTGGSARTSRRHATRIPK